jgi:hypothetical protein
MAINARILGLSAVFLSKMLIKSILGCKIFSGEFFGRFGRFHYFWGGKSII